MTALVIVTAGPGSAALNICVSVPDVNSIRLQNVNDSLPVLGREGRMVIYPIPVTVTNARIQLVADQTAKAPPRTINTDVLEVLEAQKQAEREAVLDLKT